MTDSSVIESTSQFVVYLTDSSNSKTPTITKTPIITGSRILNDNFNDNFVESKK